MDHYKVIDQQQEDEDSFDFKVKIPEEDVGFEASCSAPECTHKMVRTPSDDLYCSSRCYHYAKYLSYHKDLNRKYDVFASTLRLLGRRGTCGMLRNVDFEKISVTVDEKGNRTCRRPQKIQQTQNQTVLQGNIDDENEKPNVNVDIEPKIGTAPTLDLEIEVKPLLKLKDSDSDDITDIINELKLERGDKDKD